MNAGELRRFWDKVEPALDDSGCLLWTGCYGGQGYGWLRAGDRAHAAHRLAYEHYVGPIPGGLTLDHLCRNRLCVNWMHVEPVTRGENVMRGTGFAAENAAKTHCVHGHEFTERNTYYTREGWRRCRTCAYEQNRARRLLAGASA